MNVKIFCDSANLDEISKFINDQRISGFTTNPSLIAKSGVKNYLNFCKIAARKCYPKPISFEILSDDDENIYREGIILSDVSDNIFVKIPIVNSKGKSTANVIKQLSNEKIKINVTAVFSKAQIDTSLKSLNNSIESYISIFSGRIADTGRDPEEYIKYCSNRKSTNHEIIWASPREIFNVIQCEKLGVEIITLTPQLINKISFFDKDLEKFSIETSKMFFDDARKSKLSINIF